MVFSLIKELQKIGYEVTLLILRKNILYSNAYKQGIKVQVIRKKNGLDIQLLWRLYRYLKKEKFDIIHTHSIGSNFYGRIAKLLKWKTRLVTTVHGDTLSNLSGAFKIYLVIYFVHYIDLWMAIISDKVFSVSNNLREKLISKGLSRNKVIVIHNGINLEVLDKSTSIGNQEKLKKEFGIKNGEKIIGTVGRLIPVKNYKLLLKAAKDISQAEKKTKVLIVGDGKEENELKKLVIELKLKDNIIFTGWRTDLAHLYGIMNIFILSSKSEGLPITILEAMACKKPVVATNVGGITEAVRHGKSGLLVPSDDYIALASSIKSLLNDPNRCHAMGEEGRQIVEKKFTIEKMAANTAGVYSGLIS